MIQSELSRSFLFFFFIILDVLDPLTWMFTIHPLTWTLRSLADLWEVFASFKSFVSCLKVHMLLGVLLLGTLTFAYLVQSPSLSVSMP